MGCTLLTLGSVAHDYHEVLIGQQLCTSEPSTHANHCDTTLAAAGALPSVTSVPRQASRPAEA